MKATFSFSLASAAGTVTFAVRKQPANTIAITLANPSNRAVYRPSRRGIHEFMGFIVSVSVIGSDVSQSLGENLLLVRQDFQLVRGDLRLVAQDLVQLLLVAEDLLLIRDNRRLIGEHLGEGSLVGFDAFLIFQDRGLIAEDGLLIVEHFVLVHGTDSFAEVRISGETDWVRSRPALFPSSTR